MPVPATREDRHDAGGAANAAFVRMRLLWDQDTMNCAAVIAPTPAPIEQVRAGAGHQLPKLGLMFGGRPRGRDEGGADGRVDDRGGVGVPVGPMAWRP